MARIRRQRALPAALARLAGRIDHSTKRIDPTQVNRQIGRILQQNQRAAARFDVRLVEVNGAAGYRLEVHINTPFDDWADRRQLELPDNDN